MDIQLKLAVDFFYPIDYMLWKPIGQGSFGIVWKSRVLSGSHKNELVAVKIISLDNIQERTSEEIRVDNLLMNRKK